MELKPRAYQLGFTRASIVNQMRQSFSVPKRSACKERDEVRCGSAWTSETSNPLATSSRSGGVADGRQGAAGGSRRRQHRTRRYGDRPPVRAAEVQVSADLAGPQVSHRRQRRHSDRRAAADFGALPECDPELWGEPQVKSQRSIAGVMPPVRTAGAGVIVLSFRSPLQGLAVFGLIPFGFVGSASVVATGRPGDLFSILGMIALIGILVNDALVFVAAYNVNLTARMSRPSLGVSMSRLPHHLTSVTTVAGLAPLMLNKSFQRNFDAGIAVAFGLLFVTVIILLLLPVLQWIDPMRRAGCGSKGVLALKR